ELDGAIIVARVARDSDAARAGVRAGDALLSVDGVTTAALFAQHRVEFVGNSTARAARLETIARLFDGPRDTRAMAVFADERGRTKLAQLRRNWTERTPVLNSRRAGPFPVIYFNTLTPELALEPTRPLPT